MSKPSVLLPFLAIATILLMADYATAAGAPTKPNFFDFVCVNTTGNYTASSPYETNLISVLSDLKTQASISFFSNASAGLGSIDAVFGQYYCRGDIDSKLCGDCIQQASQSLFGNCTLFKTAAIFYEECTLRYSDQSMVGIEALLPATAGGSLLNATNTVDLLSVLDDTFGRLITESTQGTTPTLFATGEGALSDFGTVYCLVQCSPDLSGAQCDSCLRSAYTLVSKCCTTMPAQIGLFLASCQLRYNSVEPFYLVKDAPPPPPGTTSSTSSVPLRVTNAMTPPSDFVATPPSTTNSSSTTSTTSPKGASAVLRSSGVGVVMTALTLLMLLVKM